MTKEESEKLEYRIFSRIGKEKYNELLSLLNNSTHRTMSALLRDILQHKKIIVQTHDNTLDKVMEQLCGIRKELNAIGININQVTREFHKADLPEAKLYQALEIVKLYQQTDRKVTLLFEIIARLSEKWLPE